MAGFLDKSNFLPEVSSIKLMPFRFERTQNGRVLVSSFSGELNSYIASDFDKLSNLDIYPGDGIYEQAYAQGLIYIDGELAQPQLQAMRLRSRMSFLENYTSLHLFVVTLRCEHSCPYCQVSRQSSNHDLYDMNEDTARKSLDIAFQSPSKNLKLEFQGGEPLLNFPLIMQIIESAKIKRALSGKEVEFVITTNLALMTDAILDYCKYNDVLISTSLDGPEELHNKNRPRPGGNSYELAIKGIKKCQQVLGHDRVGALMTTTEGSLEHVRDIIDEYVSLNLDGIFLRPLSPYGFAIKTKQIRKYDISRWLKFYEQGLRYVLDLNHTGRLFREFYTSLLMQRIQSDRPIGYVDLRSPTGGGLGALVYNYDGRIFASDEGRMLAEMGDNLFELGSVHEDNYSTVILSNKLTSLVSESLSQCAPECHSCVFESHCGADPIYHHATQGDIVGIKPYSGFCAREKGVMNILIDLLENSPKDAEVLRTWGAL